jgi:uncharacterized protein (DUF362 family)
MWKCERCDKTWNYKVDECLFCKEKVKEMRPKEWTVKGVTQIFVPSEEHQRFPYYNLLLEDEFGNYHLKKTFKEYKIGDKIKHEVSNEKINVAVCDIDYSVEKATKRAIELIGGIKADSKTKILIKPNIVLAKNPATGIVTNPLVVSGIIEYFLSQGASNKNITIAEGSLQGVDSAKAIEKSGYGELCEKYGVKFKDILAGKFISKETNLGGKKSIIQISEEVFNADVVISVPVVKTHFQTGVSLGIKNMKGVITHGSRKIMHKGDLQDQIALLCSTLPKFITIADGSIGLEGMGPGALGKPANLGLIIAGKDPVAVDAVICRIIKLDVPGHITKAGEMGVGESNLHKIEIVGEELEVVQKQFEPADKRISPHPDIDLIDGKPCSGCLNSVWSTLYSLKEIPAEKISIAFGSQMPEFLGDSKIIAIGNCAIHALEKTGYKLKDSEKIMGCPPTEKEQKEFLKKWLKD